MLCILCVKLTDQIIDIFGENGLLFNAGSVIAKHFWIQPNQNCENTRYICCTCWNAVDSFHKFYQQVEEAHISLSKIRTTEEVGFKEELDHTSDVKTDAENVEKYGQYSDYLCADVKLEIKEDAEVYLPHDPLAVSEEKDNTDSITKPRQICAPDSDNSNDTDSEMPLSKLAKRCSSQQRNLSNSKESSASPECHDHDPTEDDDSNWGANKSTPTPKRVQKTAKKRGRSGKNIPPNLTPKQSTKEQIRKRELSHEHDEIIFKNIKLTCNICQLSLANFFSLKKHYRSTHNERGYALCCGKKFLKRCYLVDHINTHLNPEYFKCVKCEKVLVDRRSFDLHVKTHTTAKHRTFECDQCLKTFNQQLLLSRHMQIHIPEEEREFLCDICNKLFPSNYLLNAHIRNVHQNVYAKICDQCGKSIRGREAFRTHLLEHAGVPIPTVQCELCGVNLKNKYSLNRHLKSVHNESSGPHVCNICGKVSPSSSALQNHKSYVHRSQRNHKCTLCAKAFKRPGELKEHMTTHTGEVLYTCPHCPKTFNSNANMHSHRKKMHRKEWEENRRHPHMGSATGPE